MQTDRLLVQNLKALLAARQHTQRDFAKWMGHHETWAGKILKHQRGLDLKEIDRAAAFFGLDGYQLLTPGAAALTERRSGRDRRRG